MNNIMRQIGKKQEAFDYVWNKLALSVQQAREKQPGIEALTQTQQEVNDPNFVLPKIVKYENKKALQTFSYEPGKVELRVVCVKYGSKYGSDYVNKLFRGVKTHLSLPHRFHCFTEDGDGLDPEIGVIPLRNHWQAWWSKVHIFDGSVYADSKYDRQIIMYIDLDMIITGTLDELITRFDGRFATLTTNDIFCEQTQDGYNSSIMVFSAERTKGTVTSQVQVLYETLAKYYDHVLKFLMRFDHYLEMLVQNCDILQDMCPGQILDYTTHCMQAELSDTCRVVAFPRSPKPHEIVGKWPWVDKHWVY